MGELRIGLIGCGFIGRLHSWALWALRRSELISDVRVTAVCDNDAKKAESLATPHEAEVLDLHALLGAVDVAFVCTPTADHFAVVKAAAERGLAIFCEKPLAPSLGEAQLVASDLERVPHQVGLVMRSAPVFVAARDILRSGTYGRPMAIHLRDDQYFPIQGQYGSTWRADVKVAGGGTLIEHSIHDVDIFRYLAGDPVEVTCRTASFFGHPGVEDMAAATFSYSDGLVANLMSVWHQVLTRTSTRRVEIFCEHAHMWTDDAYTGPLHLETSAGVESIGCDPPAWVDELPVPEVVRRPLGQYADASLGFLRSLQAGEAVGGPSAADALAAHELVDAAYRSAAAGGEPVSIR